MSTERLLEQAVRAQHDTNQLLESIRAALSTRESSRENGKAEASIDRWKRANPLLSAACREAADTLMKVENIVISDFAAEVVNESETLKESHFARRELIDRFVPQLQQLHWLTSLVAQLGYPLPQGKLDKSTCKGKVRQGKKEEE